jgi:hypothetical protein
MADYEYLQQRINRFQTSVTDQVNRALGTAPAPRRAIPERWPTAITSPVQNDTLETAPARQAPNAAAPAVALPPVPAPSSAKTGVATRSSTPVKRAPATAKDANATTQPTKATHPTTQPAKATSATTQPTKATNPTTQSTKDANPTTQSAKDANPTTQSAKDANPTTEFVRGHQAELAGEMSPQTRDKLANALRNEPAFARYKDMMAGAANNVAIARGVNWNVGTSAERATIGRNFATLVRLAAGAN